MTILPIRELGDPVLRQYAATLDSIESPETQQLVSDMFATMAGGRGVGLAAPQVGVSKRVIIIRSIVSPAYPGSAVVEPFELINPQIERISDVRMPGYEGCLSIPGLRGLILRPAWVRTVYWDRYGHRQEMRLSGLLGRVFQHELDHLNGKVFTDFPKTELLELLTENEYQKRMAAQ